MVKMPNKIKSDELTLTIPFDVAVALTNLVMLVLLLSYSCGKASTIKHH